MRREIRHNPAVLKDWGLADRDDVALNVAALADAVARPGDPLSEERLVKNNLLFLAGAHGAIKPLRQYTRIDGSPGSTAGESAFSLHDDVSGVEFTGAVTITSTGRCRFTRCRFTEPVTMGSGAKAVFVQCHWTNKGAVDNLGAPVDAQVIGGLSDSGILHNNATITGEIVA